MLIIYNNEGKITFATSDDNYVESYTKTNNNLPFLKYGTKGLWLRGENFVDDVDFYCIVDGRLTKREESEIAKIKENRKKNMKRTPVYVKDLTEVQNVTTIT